MKIEKHSKLSHTFIMLRSPKRNTRMTEQIDKIKQTDRVEKKRNESVWRKEKKKIPIAVEDNANKWIIHNTYVLCRIEKRFAHIHNNPFQTKHITEFYKIPLHHLVVFSLSRSPFFLSFIYLSLSPFHHTKILAHYNTSTKLHENSFNELKMTTIWWSLSMTILCLFKWPKIFVAFPFTTHTHTLTIHFVLVQFEPSNGIFSSLSNFSTNSYNTNRILFFYQNHYFIRILNRHNRIVIHVNDFLYFSCTRHENKAILIITQTRKKTYSIFLRRK